MHRTTTISKANFFIVIIVRMFLLKKEIILCGQNFPCYFYLPISKPLKIY
jgi:hypothetical protein